MASVPVSDHEGKTRFTVGPPYETLWYEIDLKPELSINAEVRFFKESNDPFRQVQFSVNRVLSDSDLGIESSTNLKDWSLLAPDSITVEPDAAANQTRISSPLQPVQNTPAFYRLLLHPVN